MKIQRQEKILELIKTHEIERQEELVDLLIRAGFQATQATVSRDIGQLHLTKQSSKHGKSIYVAEPEKEIPLSYKNVLKQSVTVVDVAQNLLVVKTQPGMAMAVAAAIDALKYPEIVGTIAGDDTVMMAIRTNKEAVLVQKKIKDMLKA